jgi:hypothetical protein
MRSLPAERLTGPMGRKITLTGTKTHLPPDRQGPHDDIEPLSGPRSAQQVARSAQQVGGRLF